MLSHQMLDAKHLVDLEFIILPLFLSSSLSFFSASKTHGCGGWDKGRTRSWAKNQDIRWSGLWDCFFSGTVARAFCLFVSSCPQLLLWTRLLSVCLLIGLACPWPVLLYVWVCPPSSASITDNQMRLLNWSPKHPPAGLKRAYPGRWLHDAKTSCSVELLSSALCCAVASSGAFASFHLTYILSNQRASFESCIKNRKCVWSCPQNTPNGGGNQTDWHRCRGAGEIQTTSLLH